MYNFTGEYRVKMDAKGRIKIPKNLLHQLNHENSFPLLINRGYDKHLTLNPKDVWDEKTKEIRKLSSNKRKHRLAKRYFYRGVNTVELDNVERILIPKQLIEYAELKKDVVILAYENDIEIWDSVKYQKFLEEEPGDYGEFMENEIFGEENNEVNE
jgi:MraZ protein